MTKIVMNKLTQLANGENHPEGTIVDELDENRATYLIASGSVLEAPPEEPPPEGRVALSIKDKEKEKMKIKK